MFESLSTKFLWSSTNGLGVQIHKWTNKLWAAMCSFWIDEAEGKGIITSLNNRHFTSSVKWFWPWCVLIHSLQSVKFHF